MEDLEARLADLDRRVRELESAQPTRQPAPDGETFWALEGLEARVDPPGAVLMTGSVTLPDGRLARWQQATLTPDVLEPDFTDRAEVLAALAHPVRLTILQRVLRGATTVAELTGTEGLGTSGQVYHHLRQLTSAGWLRAIGGGRYEVPAPRVVPLLVTLMGAER